MTVSGFRIIQKPGDKNIQLKCKLAAAYYNFYQDSRWVAGKGKRFQITDHGKVLSGLAQNFSTSSDSLISQTLVIKKGIPFNFMLDGRTHFGSKSNSPTIQKQHNTYPNIPRHRNLQFNTLLTHHVHIITCFKVN